MKPIHWLACAACALSLVGNNLQAADLNSVIKGEHRATTNVARDQFRHPAETLKFFQLEPNMTVVEITPGGGWYSEILAPLLKGQGNFYAAHFPADSNSSYFVNSRRAFSKKFVGNSDTYGDVRLTTFSPSGEFEIAPANSADAVLTFRNVHNWMSNKKEQQAFDQFFTALKPGGILGVVEHRAKASTSHADMIKSGYVAQDYVIELAKNSGFVLEATSEINANSKDTTLHPKGVWTLPPVLRLGDENKNKYLAIGESDRMTLRFRKPKS
ncbi:MAG: methyltransferase [Gammaproteobacteria bacterium]|nr:methyltransferase [Gammaproteobacteria bacterium]